MKISVSLYARACLALALGASVSSCGAQSAPSAVASVPTSAPVKDTVPGRLATTWLGNSFFDRTRGGWVPDFLSALAVAPDGAVWTSGYAEAGGGGAQYKNGALVGRYAGFGSGFGDPCEAVAADDTSVYFATKNGLSRFARTASVSPVADKPTIALPGTLLEGVAIYKGEAFVSDYKAGQVRVLSLPDLKPVRAWPMERPGRIAVTPDGRVWVIQMKAGVDPSSGDFAGEMVRSFSLTGDPGASISDVSDPQALAADGRGRVLVGGLDEAAQVRFYDGASGKFLSTFGERGGILAASRTLKRRLRAAPLPLDQGFGRGWHGQLIRRLQLRRGLGPIGASLLAKGAPIWEAHGFEYCSTGVLDPDDDTRAYDVYHRFALDYSKAHGGEARFAALTVNRWKYPQDDRVTNGNKDFRLAVAVRRIGDQKFLFTTNQGAYPLWIYRLDAPGTGDIAVPCASFNGGSPETITRDLNGDGVLDKSEATPGLPGYFQYLDVTSDGDVLRVLGNAEPEIVMYRCGGLDTHGVPKYSAADSVRWPRPAEFAGAWNIRRIAYDKAADVMFIGGDPPKDKDCASRICRYDHWSDATKRVKRWDITVPTDDTSYTPNTGIFGGLPYVLRAVGDYMFIAYGDTQVRVHDRETGAYVRTLRADVPGFGNSAGAVDAKDALSVARRPNGEYVLLLEDAGSNNILVYRWNLTTR